MSEAVEFEWGEPVQVCLKYADGKRIQTTGGRTRFLFTLTDGRVMFHDEAEAERIKQQFGAGVPFWIRRNRGRGKGSPAVWEMWQGQPSATMESQLAPDASTIERDLARSIDHLNNGKSFGYGSVHGTLAVPVLEKSEGNSPNFPPQPPPTLQTPPVERKPAQIAPAPSGAASTSPRPETQIEDGLFTVIRACHKAHEYARQIGYVSMPQFTGEDIRAMAITILIGKQDRERRSA